MTQTPPAQSAERQQHAAGLELTGPERRLLARLLHDDAGSLAFELASLLPAAVLVGLGLYHDSHAAFVSAFAIVASFRVWQMRSDRRLIPVLRSLVRKLCSRGGIEPDG